MAVNTPAAAVAIPIGMRPNGPNAAAIATTIQSAIIAAPIAIRIITMISNMDLSPDCMASYAPSRVYNAVVMMPSIFPIMSLMLNDIRTTGCMTFSMRLITSEMMDDTAFRMLLINVRMSFSTFTIPFSMLVTTDCA